MYVWWMDETSRVVVQEETKDWAAWSLLGLDAGLSEPGVAPPNFVRPFNSISTIMPATSLLAPPPPIFRPSHVPELARGAASTHRIWTLTSDIVEIERTKTMVEGSSTSYSSFVWRGTAAAVTAAPTWRRWRQLDDDDGDGPSTRFARACRCRSFVSAQRWLPPPCATQPRRQLLLPLLNVRLTTKPSSDCRLSWVEFLLACCYIEPPCFSSMYVAQAPGSRHTVVRQTTAPPDSQGVKKLFASSPNGARDRFHFPTAPAASPHMPCRHVASLFG